MTQSDIEFFKTIRGTEILVFAKHFVEDQFVGLTLGPDEVWAETLDGTAFDLTDEEVEQLGIEATEAFLGREDAIEMSDLQDLDLNEYFPFGESE